MIVRTDIIEKIIYEDYGTDPGQILRDFQEDDPTYTEKDVEDYLTIKYVKDQLEWADLEDGIICSLRIFTKDGQYVGTNWFDNNGNDIPDAYVDLVPLITKSVTRYIKEYLQDIPPVEIIAEV